MRENGRERLVARAGEREGASKRNRTRRLKGERAGEI